MPPQFPKRASWSKAGRSRDAVDFDGEGRKLVQRIQQGTGSRALINSPYRHVDEIYCDVATGGRVFVGNHSAARQLDVLRKNKITNVVNCMDLTSPNWHEDSGEIAYHRFPVAHFWSDPRTGSPSGVLEYFAPLFDFIDSAVARGEGVLIHCLAGAHRAGTTGVAYLMWVHGLSATQATAVAKRARPCIDPIGDLPVLLRSLQSGLAKAAAAVSGKSAARAGGARQRGGPAADSVQPAIAAGLGFRGARSLARSRGSSAGLVLQ
eukprot:TRINITY_DN15883_c0_g1_i1.p1 TRINITY_DN15883_c0_g1~~TRINITY_DN15883_c0_g1_i1.p1  ORF type:complete len:291 (+),score=60.52 TRINITY_DN15883_c0_g1_i1:82-873(+)